MKSYDLSTKLSKTNKGWKFHHGSEEGGYFVYFKTKRQADSFVRYSNKFVKNMFIQSNQVYSDLFVIWRSVYMHYPKVDKQFKQIQSSIKYIDFQFDRWSVWSCMNSDYSGFVFKAPRNIIHELESMGAIMRKFAKTSSNTSMVYQIDSKLTYLNFLELQYKDFHKFSAEEINMTKIINLPILRVVAS
jgi:hypothetical protein